MNRQKAWIWPFCAVFISSFLFLLPARSWAQDDSGIQENDPPARVARMNFTQGSVSFQPGGEGDWVDAVPNRPLTTGDNLWTDTNSRAELHVGSTSIRLGSETSLTFLELDDHVLQLRLAQGSALVRVHHFDDDDTVEIDSPNLAFTVQRNGEYRVDVHPDGKTTIVDVYGAEARPSAAATTTPSSPISRLVFRVTRTSNSITTSTRCLRPTISPAGPSIAIVTKTSRHRPTMYRRS